MELTGFCNNAGKCHWATLVGVCLREFTWRSRVGGEGRGMEISNSHPHAGAVMGHDSWVTSQRRHHVYSPGKKQACCHDNGPTRCLCHSLLKKTSQCALYFGSGCARQLYPLCPQTHCSISSLRAAFATQHLVDKSRSFP